MAGKTFLTSSFFYGCSCLTEQFSPVWAKQPICKATICDLTGRGHKCQCRRRCHLYHFHMSPRTYVVRQRITWLKQMYESPRNCLLNKTYFQVFNEAISNYRLPFWDFPFSSCRVSSCLLIVSHKQALEPQMYEMKMHLPNSPSIRLTCGVDLPTTNRHPYTSVWTFADFLESDLMPRH